jgi:hypothetical protein
MIPVETVPGIRGGGRKRAVEGVNSSMIYLIHVRTFVNVNVITPTQHNKNKENKNYVYKVNGAL